MEKIKTYLHYNGSCADLGIAYGEEKILRIFQSENKDGGFIIQGGYFSKEESFLICSAMANALQKTKFYKDFETKYT